jgi:hypothetical protein
MKTEGNFMTVQETIKTKGPHHARDYENKGPIPRSWINRGLQKVKRMTREDTGFHYK